LCKQGKLKPLKVNQGSKSVYCYQAGATQANSLPLMTAHVLDEVRR
jgi:hypothetical protein